MIKTIAIAAFATLAAAAPALAGPGLVLQGRSLNGIAPLPKPVPIDQEASNTATPVPAKDNSTRGPLGPGGGGGIWLNGTSASGIAAMQSGPRGVMPGGVGTGGGVFLNGTSGNGIAPLPKPVPIDHEASNIATPVPAKDNTTRGPLGPGSGGGIWLNGTRTDGIAAMRSGPRSAMPGVANGGGVYLNGTSTNGWSLNGAKLNGSKLNGKYLNSSGRGSGGERVDAALTVTAVTLADGTRLAIAN